MVIRFGKHPPGLATLFFMEMWERFSYYGMRALLTLYLTKQLLFTDDMAYGVYGAYTSMVYLTPIFGGMLADRLIGFRKAVIWGAILMAAAVLLPAFLPWLDRSRVKSIRYRGWIYKMALALFVISFCTLGWLGMQPAEGIYVLMARIFSIIYFAFFLLMPYYTTIDKTKPVPDRVVYHG